jgi:hypothetical protein
MWFEMKWRINSETVRVYNLSVVDKETYATIFIKSAKKCGGSGWHTVKIHELTPLDCYDETNPYELYDTSEMYE